MTKMLDNPACPCCLRDLQLVSPRVCPECDHVFGGNGWDGIDAHWRANHESRMAYEELWFSICRRHGGPAKLVVETPDLPVIFRMKDDAPDRSTVYIPPVEMHRSLESDAIAVALIALTNNVSINLFSSWLYDKLKRGRSTRVKINRRDIEIEAGEIRRIVEETIRIS